MQILSTSLKETQEIGEHIACLLKEGDVIALFGDLGSGKTILAQSIIRALEVKEEYIISPSFVLIRDYQGKFKINHLDLYRLHFLEELLELGYEDYFYSKEGIVIIEWAQKVKELLPQDYLKIVLKIKGEFKRSIKIEGMGEGFKKRLKKKF